jgi:large subunit ribosomal protein L10
MKMTRTAKGAIVAGLTDRFSRSATIYVTDFTGLRVKNMTELRRRLKAAGGEYVVVKNTLALRALRSAFSAAAPAHRTAPAGAAGAAGPASGLDEVLRGPTGLVFVDADPVATARILADFQKEFERPAVKAGLVDGRRVTPDDVQRLASLPSREQLLGQLAGAFQAPLAGLVGAMNGLLYQMVGALEALKAQRETAA